MQRLSLLLVATLMLAGCLGGADEPTQGTEVEEAPVENVSQWSSNNWSGTVTSVSAGVASYNADGEFMAEPVVDDDTTVLYLNLTVTASEAGSELEMIVGAPGCDVNSDCEERKSTSDGTASFVVDDPDDGTWRVRVFKDGPGADEVSWELGATQKLAVSASASE